MTTRLPTTNSDALADDTWVGDRQPDASVFFTSPAQDQLFDLVRHLLENTGDIALLIGAHGAGKSTFIYRLNSQAPEHWKPCRVDANPMLHPEQLFGVLARCIGSRHLAANPAETLGEAFATLRLQGRLPVIVVDDAQQLPIGSLLALLQLHEFRADMNPAFALVLIAESSIDESIETHALQAISTAQFHRLEMPLLALEQMSAYIQHFLEMEGIGMAPAFSQERLADMHRQSGGVPGRVNEQVMRALRGGVAAQKKKFLPLAFVQRLRKLPPMTLIASLTAALVLGLVLLYQQAINQWFQATPPRVLRQDNDARKTIPGIGQATVSNGVLVQSLALPPAAAQSPREERLPPVAASKPVAQPAPEALSEPLIPPALATLPQQQPASASASAPRLPEAPPAPPPPAQAITESALPPRAPVQPAVLAEVSAPAKKPAAEPKAQPAPTTIKVAKASAAAAAAAYQDQGYRKEAWLMAQNPAHYSLQILAVSNEQAIPSYIKRHQLSNKVFYYASQRKGQPWFSLLYGVYATRGEALAALKQLPAQVQKSGGWPRKLADIQASIRSSAQ
jgi:DamX protein